MAKQTITSIPFTFQRLEPFPLDSKQTFNTYNTFVDYVTSSTTTAFSGLIAFVADTNSVYYLDKDKQITLLGYKDGILTLTDTVTSNSPKWTSTYSTVFGCSGVWQTGGGLSTVVKSVSTTVNTCSGNWDKAYSQVYSCSGKWDTGGSSTILNSVSTTVTTCSGKWDSAYSQVNSCSGGWQTGGGLSTIVRSVSTTVNTCSGNWESVYSHTKSCSGEYALKNCANTFSAEQTINSNLKVNCNLNVGTDHELTGGASTIAGGVMNRTTGHFTIIGGGQYNSTDSEHTAILGGIYNKICCSSMCSTIGGGQYNVINASTNAGIFGGAFNCIDAFANAFVIGSNLSAVKACATHMNEAVVFGAISARGIIYAGGGAWDNSACWNAITQCVINNAASWTANGTEASETLATTYSTVRSCSGGWESAYSQTNANSNNWNSVYTHVSTVSSNWDSVYSHTKAQSSNWDSVYSHTKAQSGKWDSVYSHTNTQSGKWNDTYTTFSCISSELRLTSSVTSCVSAGSIVPGTILDNLTTFDDFVRCLLIKTFYPTYTLNSTSGTNTCVDGVQATTVEIGAGRTIVTNINYNKGQILGAKNNGIWDPTKVQASYTGDATCYYFVTDSNSSTSPTIQSTGYTIQEGSNTLSISARYNAGSTPVDSDDQLYAQCGFPAPAGVKAGSIVITGQRKSYFGTNINANTCVDTAANIKANLTTQCLGLVNNSIVCLPIPQNTALIAFAYPASIGSVDSVIDTTGNNDVKTSFTNCGVAIGGINDFSPTPYCVYYYRPTAPFGACTTYRITI